MEICCNAISESKKNRGANRLKSHVAFRLTIDNPVTKKFVMNSIHEIFTHSKDIKVSGNHEQRDIALSIFLLEGSIKKNEQKLRTNVNLCGKLVIDSFLGNCFLILLLHIYIDILLYIDILV